MRIKKRCGNCARYFVNSHFEKWCADQTKGYDGKISVKLRARIGAMGDEYECCAEWTPADYIISLKEEEKRERANRRVARAAKDKEANDANA